MAATRMKTVCVVGAGPAGLVTAKTLLKHGGYFVTVYEAAGSVGGMWRGDLDEHGDKCGPEMKTNLSRFTVAFSDLSWSNVDLSDPATGSSSSAPPMFPQRWQVGRYLGAYVNKFGLSSNIFLNKRVIKVEYLDNFQWRVVTKDTVTKQQMSGFFDHLIVASGFFDQPARSFDPSPSGDSPNIQHSSLFRTLPSLTEKAGKIVVIGGGISGSEAAAQAAFQISNAKHAPSKAKPEHADSKVYHIINRPFYPLPRFLPLDPHHLKIQDSNSNLAPKFLPLDLILYNLSRRGDGEISAAITTVPPEKARKGHEFMRSVIGGDLRDLEQPALVYKPGQTQYPGYSGITDTYAEFVRSGLIVPVQGWVQEVKAQENDEDEDDEDDSESYDSEDHDSETFDIVLKQYDPWYHAPWKEAKVCLPNELFLVTNTDSIQEHSVVEDVVGIIEATGYNTNLDYLDDDMKEQLYYDSYCARIPYLLGRGSIFAECVPSIGFVGFYEGPYWGVMEMQARIIADTWSQHDMNSGYRPDTKFFNHDATERMRSAIRYERSLQVPQFWMSDYVGIVEELAREAGVQRDDTLFNGQAGPMFPSRYQATGTDPEAASVVKEVVDLLEASQKQARFVAAAVFRGMQGVWKLNRKIDSRNAAAPGGTFTGTAHFHPRTCIDGKAVPGSRTFTA